MSVNTAVPVAPGRLPVLGHLLPLMRGRLAFLESLRLLGDVVRIAFGNRPVYVITAPELAYQVLVTQSSCFEKGLVVKKVRRVLGNGVGTSNGAVHLRQRRLMQPAFHRKRIAEYVDAMRQRTCLAIDRWHDGQTLVLNDVMFTLALDIMTDTLFPSDIGPGTGEAMQATIRPILDGVLFRTLLPELFEKLPLSANRRFDRAIIELRRIVADVIAHARAIPGERNDLLSILMAARDEDDQTAMSEQQLCDEVVTLLFGGTESVSNVMTWLFHELGRHPEVRARVQAEIDAVLDGRLICADDITKLHYTECVIKEVLRLHTPPWLLMRHTLKPVLVGSMQLQPGDEVMVSPTMVHRDASIYDKSAKL